MRLNESLTRGTSTFDVAIVLCRLHWRCLHGLFGPGLIHIFWCFSQCSNNATNTYHMWALSFFFCVSVSTLHILFTLTSFWFWHAFCFIRTAIRAAGGFQAIACQKGGCSTRSYSSIFHRFYFSLTGYFYFRRVVRNDSLVRRLRRQRSRPCAVGR